jgi:hypothetical protein
MGTYFNFPFPCHNTKYLAQREKLGVPHLKDPTTASDRAIMRLIITNPLERFLIKNYFEYYPDEGVLRIAPQLWQELRHMR